MLWSILEVAKKSPESWNAHDHTAWVCSVKVAVQHALTKSHILTVLSPEAVARWVPRGWKATPLIQSLWPSPDIIRSPFGIDHIFQVLSSLTVATIAFLGWWATPETASWWPLYVLESTHRFTLDGSGILMLRNGLSRSSAGHLESLTDVAARPVGIGAFFGPGAVFAGFLPNGRRFSFCFIDVKDCLVPRPVGFS